MTETVYIIGAPRSGTNMLRDLLVKLPGFGTWPCDEINYIWRHGNRAFPSDLFERQMATPRVTSFIRKEFDKLAANSAIDVVVEKTCANSLRVEFIDEVQPDARYVFIVRDGVDVASSAMHRWKAPLDLQYILAKARFVPPSDLPYYAFRYGINRLKKLISRESRLQYWGPTFTTESLDGYSLAQICALQWKACVNRSEQGFSSIDESRIFRVRYEDFVVNPTEEFLRLSDFLGQPLSAEACASIVGSVSRGSVSKGREGLPAELVDEVKHLIRPELERYGYSA